jgi:hypothetical protein
MGTDTRTCLLLGDSCYLAYYLACCCSTSLAQSRIRVLFDPSGHLCPEESLKLTVKNYQWRTQKIYACSVTVGTSCLLGHHQN